MRIVWDERKRQANLARHGMDFAALDLDFFGSATVRVSHSSRMLGLGRQGDGMILAVAFRPLGFEGVSIISMRPASRPERRLYEQG